MPHDTPGDDDYRVLILPPTRRDGEVTCDLLRRAGITCIVCPHPSALSQGLAGAVGAIILTDAIVSPSTIGQLSSALDQQPPWSDIPTILLSRTEQSESTGLLLVKMRNVTILDRPTSRRSLVSAVEAALRARRRQYQIRDQLTALREGEESLRNADRRKDEFLAMLAHELRNPLAPIRTATEVLARTLPAQDHNRATADLVKRQVTHLTRLVDDLLDVSRITQGRIQLHHSTLDLSIIVAQAIEATEAMLREKHHVVSRLSDLQPLYVNGDAARLLQCVTNLLTNAAKYTDPGGDIRIQLRAEQEQAVLSISDNGIGIAPELLPSIFELFVQSERSLDRSQGGLGIGLSVVQRLVRMHGGNVKAISAGPGRGATFEIRLPRVPPPQAAAALPLQPKVAAKNILVVDDNEDAADSLAALLRLDGHHVQAVYSASAALQAVRSAQPAIVLLDIGLPEMDGYQVAREIRATTGGIRLVALTGYGQAEDIARTRAAGFDAHLVKPVDFEALERAIVPEASKSAAH